MTVEDVTEDEGSSSSQQSVIRLRGLPFHSQPEDVRAFFHPTVLDEIYFCRRDGRPTGEAYVVLAAAADVQACFGRLDKKYIGNRYIELFEATAADLRAVKKMLEDRSLQGYVVRLRGLPYSATESDVRAFMDGVQLSESTDCIVFAHSLNGRPTGEAYIELADEQALSLAMTRHKEVMGTRYIEVFNSSKMDKLQAQKQLEGLSSPQLDRNRFAPGAAAVHGSAPSSHRSLAFSQQHQPVRQMPGQTQASYHHGTAADPLADRFAQCYIGPAAAGWAMGPMSGGLITAAGAVSTGPPLPQAHMSLQGPAGMLPVTAGPSSAYPPPGLQAVPVSQPGLQQQRVMPQVSGPAPLAMGGVVGYGGAGLSHAGLQLGHMQPMMTAVQPMMTAAMPAGMGHGLVPYTYVPQQQHQQQHQHQQQQHQQQVPVHLTDGQLLVQGGHMAVQQARLAHPAGSDLSQASSHCDLQQLAYLPPGSVGPVPPAVTMAAASQQSLPQVLLPAWSSGVQPACPQETNMGWHQNLPHY